MNMMFRYFVRFSMLVEGKVVSQSIEDPTPIQKRMGQHNTTTNLTDGNVSPAEMLIEVFDYEHGLVLCTCPTIKAAHDIAAQMNKNPITRFDVENAPLDRRSKYLDRRDKFMSGFSDFNKRRTEHQKSRNDEDYVVHRALEKNRERLGDD